VEDVSARIQPLGTVEQAESRLDCADPLVGERRSERPKRAGADDGVGIEEDDDVGLQQRDATIAATPEAEVRTGLDDRDVVPCELERAAVVDDDDLVGIVPQRQQTPLEMVAAVICDDDDADAQYAPRRATTAGIVFARIEMSSQIDQFSR
jgi:hypothetical protein